MSTVNGWNPILQDFATRGNQQTLITAVGQTNTALGQLVNGVTIANLPPAPLTDDQLRATPVATSVANWPSTFDLPTEQVTALQGRSWALTQGGDALTAHQGGSWTVGVNNHPANYPLPADQVVTLTPQKNALTDTELRAIPVNVVTQHQQALTNTQLRAASVVVVKEAPAATLKYELIEGMELRRETSLSDDWYGSAPDGSLETSPVWLVVRHYKNAAGQIYRTRYRENVRWDQKEQGWS